MLAYTTHFRPCALQHGAENVTTVPLHHETESRPLVAMMDIRQVGTQAHNTMNTLWKTRISDSRESAETHAQIKIKIYIYLFLRNRDVLDVDGLQTLVAMNEGKLPCGTTSSLTTCTVQLDLVWFSLTVENKSQIIGSIFPWRRGLGSEFARMPIHHLFILWLYILGSYSYNIKVLKTFSLIK